jgi:hypothetical protein
MKEIGGYFELELRKGKEYHRDAICLNSARNALEIIISLRKYSKVFIPYYACDVILEPFKKLGAIYEFYFIDKNLEPIFNYDQIKDDEGFLYINYFGIKDSFLCQIAKECRNLIIDNSQSFFSIPVVNIPTFYSCRKFFGVPDGAYLYIDGITGLDIAVDHSDRRFSHLLKRIDYNAETGYNEFKMNDQGLSRQPVMQMSNLTRALLCNIDYEFVKKRRIENFLIFQDHLAKYNKINIALNDNSVPMVYPFRTENANLRTKLAQNKIYIATYWQNIFDWSNENMLENSLAKQILALPVDQRYDENDILKIIRLIR